MSITTSTQWDSLASQSRTAPIPLIRLYYGNESNYLSISNQDVTLDGERFLGILLSSPSHSSKIDIFSHESSVGTVRLDISNLEYEPGKRFSDNMTTLGTANDYGFYNRKVDIVLYIPGITSWANCFPLFTGYVRDIKQSRDKVTLDCEDGSELQYTTIPRNPIGFDNIPSTILVPVASDAIGVEKKVVYGDHIHYLGSTDRTTAKATYDNCMVKGTFLGIDSSDNRVFSIAGHALDQVESVWAFDPQLNRMVKANTFSTITDIITGEIFVKLSQDTTYYDYWFSNGTVTYVSGADFDDPDNVGDRDLTTEGSFDVEGSGTTGATYDVEYPAYDTIIEDSAISTVDIFAFAELIPATSPPMVFTINSTQVTSSDADTVSQYGTQTATKAGIETDVRFLFTKNTADVGRGSIYEIYKRIEYTPVNQTEMDVFISCKGLEYDTWIDSRTGHADNNASGDVIENAAGVLESILRDQMGLATADIDEAAFNTLSTPMATYSTVLSIKENTSTKDILQNVLKHCKSYLWKSPGRKWTCTYIADTYSSSDAVINYDEITDFRISQSPLSELSTNVIVKYEKSESNDQNQIKATGTAASNNQTFYNITEDQGTLVIEAETIKDSTAGADLQDFEQKNRKLLHNIVSGKIDKQYLSLDIGDVIEFSNMPFSISGEDITSNQTRVSQTVYKYFMIYAVERSDMLEFSAIQLHNLS